MSKKMKSKDLKIGDRVKIRNSIECTVLEITKNGWIKCCWMFHNNGRFLGMSKTEMQFNSFRASDIEKIIRREQ